jgi:uncharacterized membrane protein YhiD involved in acid resistance
MSIFDQSRLLNHLTVFSIFDISLMMLMAFGIGVFIFWIYKHTYSGIMYSGSFGVSLIGLTMISTLVILAVTSNVVLSLGMVGALSIVRFRTAIKDPLDIVFLFWSIGVGIVLAAGLIPLAVIGSLFIGVALFVFINRKSYDHPYILMVICDDQKVEQKVRELTASAVKKMLVKSKSVSKGHIELNFEVRLPKDDTSFINQLSDLEGVSNAILVSYNGDYMG